jgi:hypothetical protein
MDLIGPAYFNVSYKAHKPTIVCEDGTSRFPGR